MKKNKLLLYIMTHTKIKVDRKQLRRDRLENKHKSYVDIVDEEHKELDTNVVQEKVENVVEKKTKRKYKKNEVKKD